MPNGTREAREGEEGDGGKRGREGRERKLVPPTFWTKILPLIKVGVREALMILDKAPYCDPVRSLRCFYGTFPYPKHSLCILQHTQRERPLVKCGRADLRTVNG